VARAIALDSTKESDLDSQDLSGLTSDQIARLEAKKEQLKKLGCGDCGSVVPLKSITMAELERHNGADPELPIYLAIEGVVYNVSKGRQFYGPDGVYPFAGRECARAFALLSTDVSECNKNLSGLSPVEMEHLKDWQAKFNSKYPIIGKIVD
jgi:membrane-associated progesterone receptor component